MKKSLVFFLAAAAFSTFAVAAPLHGTVAVAATPPPPPPSLPPLPAYTPTVLTPAGTTPAPVEPDIFATPTPPPNSRKGIDGVWEVQIQRGDQVEYTHFKIKQDQNVVTGVYLDKNKKQYALAGTLDGKNIRIIVTLKDGTSLTFTATLDGTTDMLGLLTSASDSIPFTAAYRPKENILENINAGPGVGGAGGMTNGPP